MTHLNLQQQRILITRPQADALRLAQLVTQHHGIAQLAPALTIKHLSLDQHAQTTLQQANTLVFLSQHAVAACAPYHQQIKRQCCIIAIGPRSQRALKEQGFLKVHTPAHACWQSLVAMPALNPPQQPCVIVAGQGGKAENIQAALTGGAAKIAVYQRQPHPDFADNAHTQTSDIILASSQAILQQICQLEPKKTHCPLVVISPSMLKFAKDNGFKTVILAHDASNQALLEACHRYIQGASL
jgi:uroporphyrinogen-III synthase